MSDSMFITVYFRTKNGDNSFNVDLNLAKKIFKYLWEKEHSGFENNGNIKGLLEYYIRSDWSDDMHNLEKEDGSLKILQLETPLRDKNYSFGFHNYGDGGETKLTEKVDIRDIYLLFAEILSTCFGYTVQVNDNTDVGKYNVFFDGDGRKYIITDNRSEYIKAVRDFVYACDSISENTKKLVKVKEKLSKYRNNLESFEKK